MDKLEVDRKRKYILSRFHFQQRRNGRLNLNMTYEEEGLKLQQLNISIWRKCIIYADKCAEI